MNLNDYGDTLFATTPTPSPEQIADARAYVNRNAPDLLEAIFGSES